MRRLRRISVFALLAGAAVAHAQPQPATLRVYVVRHASAWKNVPPAQRPHPMSDDELDSLTPAGLERATAVGRELVGHDVVAVYCSPARRAQQTAAAIAKALGVGEPIASDAFRTLDSGSDARAASGTARIKNWKVGSDPRFPGGGESLADGYARAAAELAKLAQQYSGHAIVVVTHGEIASSLLTHADGQDLLAGYFKHFPDEGSVNEIRVP